MPSDVSPKDRFITVYGRKPVLEALADDDLHIDKVVIAHGLQGPVINQITEAAAARAVHIHHASAHRVKVLAGNGRHDQGVLADIQPRKMRPLTEALDDAPELSSVLLLDGVLTPGNVGMILRTVTAAGVDGIVVPRRGVASLDPLVVKASAGVAFRAPILRAPTAGEAAELLSEAGYRLIGLDSAAEENLFDAAFCSRTVFVLGSESGGVSEEVRRHLSQYVAIPMRNSVESLNVASAATVVSFELARRRAR